MAKNSSFIKLEGTLDGLTFFKKNGQNFVKTKSEVNRNRIANAPEFQRTRENNQEFGGSAKCGKAFRESFAGIARVVGDSYLTSRVTAKMRSIVPNGTGLRGQRNINLVDNLEPFIGFNFDVSTPFDSIFNAPSVGPDIPDTKDGVRWNVEDFNTDTFVRSPEGATHFKLALAAGYVSNYEWDATLKSYEPVEEQPNAVGVVAYSDAIALGGMVGSPTGFDIDLTGFAPVPVTTALFASTAIVFYQMVNGELYILAQGHSMKIAAAK
ncbi:hypothetical protein [Winogradskyella aquimaris]|uniref:Major tropism determinant N-terminal domain-containing protein n=1 Tax=Winogradskyella aquimaris TaxID=864074 RepID=A0ABU5EKJ7_9FLAO|nr:hypothetical protein [Winogradskyella aquimaris]MDY2586793.1 hypothetical protein [Winogradskyella aquimaris]